MKKAYHPAKFRETRYQKFDITTSGHIGLPYDYNAWLHRMKRGEILKSLHRKFTKFADKNVLEFGCSTGAYMDLWYDLGVKSITGVDISQSSISNLQKLYSDSEFFCQDISDESGSGILARGVAMNRLNH